MIHTQDRPLGFQSARLKMHDQLALEHQAGFQQHHEYVSEVDPPHDKN
jgi:hypothetical protein